jgi:hypothetical protein
MSLALLLLFKFHGGNNKLITQGFNAKLFMNVELEIIMDETALI